MTHIRQSSLRFISLVLIFSLLAMSAPANPVNIRTHKVATPSLPVLTASSLGLIPIAESNHKRASSNLRVDKATEVRAKVSASYARLPMSFEINAGQTDDSVKFFARGHGYGLFFTADEAVLALHKGDERMGKAQSKNNPATSQDEDRDSVVRMRLIGANRSPEVVGEDEQVGKSNYFIGNDPAKWQRDVSRYSKVRYKGVYSGIDQLFYGNQSELEYDFIVSPLADYRNIRMSFTGAKSVNVDQRSGDLVIKTKDRGEIRQPQPYVYQKINGEKKEITSRYILEVKDENTSVSFQVGEYDQTKPLIIDPSLVYSTYLGGSDFDSGNAIAVDTAGNAYVTGFTKSLNFPTQNPFQSARGGSNDAFVTKLNATGNGLVYSTYLGGGNGSGNGNAIAVDSSGNAYVTGNTTSPNFPTQNALQSTIGGGNTDAFVTKLNATGNGLIYSTYLGGSGNDDGSGIAVDTAGNAYVTGFTSSINFPTLNAFQSAFGGNTDAFVTKLNATGSGLVYSTYLGGTNLDFGNAIAVDTAGNAYVTGNTTSPNFPTQNAFQSTFGGGNDAFVTKLSATGSGLIYSTYLGGSGDDVGKGIALDTANNAYVTGFTSSGNFPTQSAFQNTFGGTNDAFVTKLNTTGNGLVYSTYLGGSGDDDGNAIAVDSSGNAYVTGNTTSPNFPTLNAFQSGNANSAFVTEFNSTSGLVYSTYLGTPVTFGQGVAVDTAGNAYVTGSTNSPNFPTQNAFQGTFVGTRDGFVTKLPTASPSISITSPTNGQIFTAPTTITLIANASVNIGSISKVEFFEGGVSVGTAINTGGNQFSLTLQRVAVGTHSYKAQATSDTGLITNSQQINITVNPGAAPTISITSPPNGQTFTAPTSITLIATASVVGGAITNVEFFEGSRSVGVATNISGNQYTLTLPNVSVGIHTYTARAAADTGRTSDSSTVTITVNSPPPTVSITSPTNGQVFTAPANFNLTANASVAVGSITRVEFFDGQASLGTGTSSGNNLYTLALSNVSVGTHSYTARATTDAGQTATSSVVSVTVNNPTPTVTITSPTNSQTFTAPATITLTANASISSGTISKVEFFNGSTSLGSVTSAPYSLTLNNLPAGSYIFTAVATSNANVSATSAPVSVTVNNPVLTVSITSPIAGQTYAAPASFTLTASPKVASGSITKVEFFDGTTLVGSATKAPFSIPLSNVGAGTHSYTAKATTDTGTTATSSPVVVTVTAVFQAAVQFGSSSYSAGLSTNSVTVTVTRTGDPSAFSVDYSTSDDTASERSDYSRASGTLNFASGEMQKSFTVLIVHNGLGKGTVSLNLNLSNPTNGVVLGTPSGATLSIAQSSSPSATNPIDDPTFYVRQHYLDFLNRETDPDGLNFWVIQITSCVGDSKCIDIKRQNVSAAFFLSREFQETGFYVLKIQRAAFGKVSQDANKRLTYPQFIKDSRNVGDGFVDGRAGADQILDQNKTAYALSVVNSTNFNSQYPTSLSASAYVDALFSTAGVTPSSVERQDAINAFGSGGTAGRAATLRKIAESNSIKNAEFSPAFVLLQYFGYLRRNPTDAPDNNDAGYQFWLNKLNSFSGDYIRSEMVRSFILSQEYRKRFGQS